MQTDGLKQLTCVQAVAQKQQKQQQQQFAPVASDGRVDPGEKQQEFLGPRVCFLSALSVRNQSACFLVVIVAPGVPCGKLIPD
jgi:hypothetical protein